MKFDAKLRTLFSSRRFYAVIVIAAWEQVGPVIGLDPETVRGISHGIMVWIVSDAINKTGS